MRYYQVVAYQQVQPGVFLPGTPDLRFDDYQSALTRAEEMQAKWPVFWWRVETRRADGKNG